MGRVVPVVIIVFLLIVPAGVLALDGLSDDNGTLGPSACTGNNNSFNHVSHEPIIIWSDAQFASLADENGWSGNGTYEAPYAIQDYQIQAGAYSSCIEIQNVDSHFVIRDCDLSSDGSGLGVHLYCAPNGRIESCVIHSVFYALYLWFSSGTTIYNNTLFDAQNGITLVLSSGCIVESNYLTNCSLDIWADGPEQWLHNVSGNYVNEMELGYFRELSNTTIDASTMGQVILVQCEYVIVRNGVFYGIGIGILLGYCRDCAFIDCESVDNVFGLYSDHSWEGLINGCSIGHNKYGVWLNQSSYSWNISGNVIWMNSYAGVVSVDGNSLLLMDSVITDGGTGVWLYNENGSCLWDNEISHNQVGLRAEHSDFITFEANVFSYNSEYGLDLYACNDCEIYYNCFIDNGVGNARDEGGPNTWDDGYSAGNCWSDYTGVGVYSISGSANSVDRYPLLTTDTTAPYTTGNVTTGNNTGTGSLNLVSAIMTAASVAVILVVGYVLVRGRGSMSYQ